MTDDSPVQDIQGISLREQQAYVQFMRERGLLYEEIATFLGVPLAAIHALVTGTPDERLRSIAQTELEG